MEAQLLQEPATNSKAPTIADIASRVESYTFRDDELLTDAELARHVKVNPRLPAHWRCQGTGPPYIRIGGRRVVYRWADVRAYLAAQTFTSTSQETAQTA